MQCNCGSNMVKRNMIRNKEIVGTMMVCKAKRCGRVEKSQELKDYLKKHGSDNLKETNAE